jgi:hypothetical protein
MARADARAVVPDDFNLAYIERRFELFQAFQAITDNQ